MQILEERTQPTRGLDGVAERGEDLGMTDGAKAWTPSLPFRRAALNAAHCPSRSPCSFGSPGFQEGGAWRCRAGQRGAARQQAAGTAIPTSVSTKRMEMNDKKWRPVSGPPFEG